MSQSSGGYVAFTSVVVISAALLLLATAGSVRGWYVRSNVLDREFKLRSEALAYGCVEQTLLYLAKDPLFVGPATSTFKGGVCVVGAIEATILQKEFTVYATYQTAHTNIHIVVDDALEVTSWEEIST